MIFTLLFGGIWIEHFLFCVVSSILVYHIPYCIIIYRTIYYTYYTSMIRWDSTSLNSLSIILYSTQYSTVWYDTGVYNTVLSFWREALLSHTCHTVYPVYDIWYCTIPDRGQENVHSSKFNANLNSCCMVRSGTQISCGGAVIHICDNMIEAKCSGNTVQYKSVHYSTAWSCIQHSKDFYSSTTVKTVWSCHMFHVIVHSNMIIRTLAGQARVWKVPQDEGFSLVFFLNWDTTVPYLAS